MAYKKLSPAQEKEIARYYSCGANNFRLAKVYGISSALIDQVARRFGAMRLGSSKRFGNAVALYNSSEDPVKHALEQLVFIPLAQRMAHYIGRIRIYPDSGYVRLQTALLGRGLHAKVQIKPCDVRSALIEYVRSGRSSHRTLTHLRKDLTDRIASEAAKSTFKPMPAILREYIGEAMNVLSKKEKAIIDIRFGMNHSRRTLEETGRAFDLTRERIRQIEKGALKKLSRPPFLKVFQESREAYGMYIKNPYDQHAEGEKYLGALKGLECKIGGMIRKSAMMLECHYPIKEVKKSLERELSMAIGYTEPPREKQMDPEEKRRALLGTPVDRLALLTRPRRCIEYLGIKTLGDLASRRSSDLLMLRNFGKTSLKEIMERLAEVGLKLRD